MFNKPASFVRAPIALGCNGSKREEAQPFTPRLRHRRLTNSAARTNPVLLIRRTVRLAAASLLGLFEHPEPCSLPQAMLRTHQGSMARAGVRHRDIVVRCGQARDARPGGQGTG